MIALVVLLYSILNINIVIDEVSTLHESVQSVIKFPQYIQMLHSAFLVKTIELTYSLQQFNINSLHV